ncbi:reverse transcriptase domain-containing protein [Tanacetum coccineum]
MTADENYDSESDKKEPSFEKITINTDYKIKTSLEEPLMDLELKHLPDNLEYVFLEEPFFLPVIISSQISAQNKSKLVYVLKRHNQAFAWKITDILGICPSFCKHKIQLMDDKKLVIQKQRRLNLNMQEVVKKGIVKLLDTSINYPISDSPWVSPIHRVLKKGGITVVTNQNDELILTRTITGWRIKDKKGTENVAADHLSWIDNNESSDDSEVNDNFPGETLMEINTRNEPCKIMENTMKRYGVNRRFSTSYHPQTSGQVENTNKALKRILEKTAKDNPPIWSRKLDDALWAFRTTYKTPTGTTPYKLIYGKNYHLPFEIEHRAY